VGHFRYIGINFSVGRRPDFCRHNGKNDEMKTIRKLLDKLSLTAHELSLRATEPDEFVVVNDLEIAIHEAEKVFERTKNINGE